MDIKLEVENYCEDCLYFEPDIIAPIMTTDTVVRCKNRYGCAHVARYLREEKERQNG